MNPRRLTIHPEVKILSAKEGTCEYLATDQTIDSYREILRAAGAKFDRFQKNAPFVDSHNYGSIADILGKVTGWRMQKVNGKDGWVQTVQWAIDVQECALAQLGWKMTVGGYLKAVSVGVFPTAVRSKWRDADDFAKACGELKLSTEDAARLESILWEWDQYELSAVVVGANPSAIALSHKTGVISDEDLHKVGFTTADDLTFLHESAAGFDAASPVLRRHIRAELKSIFTSKSPTAPPSATNAQRSAAAGNKDAQRKALLAEVSKLTRAAENLKTSLTHK